MAGSAMLHVQRAIYDALDGAVTLNGEPVPVFVNVPAGTARPYIALGAATEQAFNTHDGYGSITTQMIHTWIEGGEMHADAKRLVDSLCSELDGATLTLQSGSFVSCDFDGAAEVTPEPDGVSVRGAIRFRVIVEGL